MGVSEWYDDLRKLFGDHASQSLVGRPLLKAAYDFEDISRRAGALQERLREEIHE